MCSTFDACQTNNNYIERYRVSQKYLGMLKGFLKSIKMEGINKRVRGVKIEMVGGSLNVVGGSSLLGK